MQTNSQNVFAGVDISTTSVSDAVYSAVRQAIIEGRLEAGAVMQESVLARDLGVSRTPLREAMERLRSEALIERTTSGRLRVTTLSTKDAEDAINVREALEGMVGRLVAERFRTSDLVQEDIGPVFEVVRQQAALTGGEDPVRLMTLGDEFHRSIWMLTENDWLVRYLNQILASLRRYRYILWNDSTRRKQNIVAHEELLRTLAKGDPDEAEHSMRAHIRSGRELYLANAEKIGGASRQT